MTTFPKYTLSTLFALIFATCLYFLYQNIERSQSENTTSTNTGVSQTSSSAIETDSGKRLTTYSESGSNWGMSPFGSGKPLEEEKKLEFKKPNTEWKTRTLSGITYVFGEGNPREVAPKLADYASSDEYVQSETVRPNTEKFLKEFLSNPVLVKAINKCGSLMKPQDGELESQLPNSLFNTDFSIETMILIDPITGQKMVESTKFNLIGNALYQIRSDRTNSGKKESFLANQCLSLDEIIDFDQLLDQYRATQDSISNGSPVNRKEMLEFVYGKNHNRK